MAKQPPRSLNLPTALLAPLVGLLVLIIPPPVFSQTQAEIDQALNQLSEILGALSHLETVCDGEQRASAERSRSRSDMEQLLASEELDPVRQSLLIDAYNRGFRNVANTHRQCTSASTRLVDLHHASGAQIVAELIGEGNNRLTSQSGDENPNQSQAEDTAAGVSSTEEPPGEE